MGGGGRGAARGACSHRLQKAFTGSVRSPSNTCRLFLSSVWRPPHSRFSLRSVSPPSSPATSAKERLSAETGSPEQQNAYYKPVR